VQYEESIPAEAGSSVEFFEPILKTTRMCGYSYRKYSKCKGKICAILSKPHTRRNCRSPVNLRC